MNTPMRQKAAATPPRSRCRAQQPRHVGGGAAAVRRGEGAHRGERRADHRGVLHASARAARTAGAGRRASSSCCESGQGQGQEVRPVELLPAAFRDRPRAHQPRLRLHRRRARQVSARLGVAQLLGARHRQHGGAGAGRHARAEEEVAEAAAQRRDPLGLCHDRAGRRLVRRQEHRHPRRARRRRVGDQRREVLHLRRRRPALQDHDRHGQDQPRRLAAVPAVADPGADGHARRRDRRADDRVRPRPRAARPHAPEVQQLPRAGREHPAGRGPRLRDQPGPPRPGPHPSLHALDRLGREGARPDGQARRHPHRLRQADHPARQEPRAGVAAPASRSRRCG